jgi:hypothetical protein
MHRPVIKNKKTTSVSNKTKWQNNIHETINISKKFTLGITLAIYMYCFLKVVLLFCLVWYACCLLISLWGSLLLLHESAAWLLLGMGKCRVSNRSMGKYCWEGLRSERIVLKWMHEIRLECVTLVELTHRHTFVKTMFVVSIYIYKKKYLACCS